MKPMEKNNQNKQKNTHKTTTVSVQILASYTETEAFYSWRPDFHSI